VILAFSVIGLLHAYFPAYTDRKDFSTVDGDAIRWVGVALFAVGGALRIWPVYVLGNRFSGFPLFIPFALLTQSCSFRRWGSRRIELAKRRQRKHPEEQLRLMIARANQELAKIPDGIAFVFPPPSILGIGTSGGFTFLQEDRGGPDPSFLAQQTRKFVEAAAKRPELRGSRPGFSHPKRQVSVARLSLCGRAKTENEYDCLPLCKLQF
jgi:hypothetical protein